MKCRVSVPLALMCLLGTTFFHPSPSHATAPPPCFSIPDPATGHLDWWCALPYNYPLWLLLGPPLDGDPVNLATGGEEYRAPADLTAYNPGGPSATFQRAYYSQLANRGHSAPGLSSGWVNNYDYAIYPVNEDGSSLLFVYPNGAIEPVCSDGTIAGPTSAPYVVSGVLHQSITVTWPDLAQWVFTYDGTDPADYTNTYTLHYIADRMGHQITINHDPSHNNRLTNITAPGVTNPLLAFAYDDTTSPGMLQTVSNNLGRTVTYATTVDGASNVRVLSQVSCVDDASSTRFLYEYDYESAYSQFQPFLAHIKKPNPAAITPAFTGVTVNYQSDGAGGFRVMSVVDATGNSRAYTLGSTYSPPSGCTYTGTLVQVKNPSGTVVRSWLQKLNTNGQSVGVYDNGRESYIYYDSAHPCLPADVYDSAGRRTQFTYGSHGRLASVTVPSTAPSGFTKTTFGWTDSATLGYPYPAALTVQSGDANPSGPQKTPSKYTFDPASTSDPTHNHGFLTKIEWPQPGNIGVQAWNEATYTYDSLGNVTGITKPAPASPASPTTIIYGYGSQPKVGHPTSITVPLTSTTNSVSTLVWNANGTLASVTDALNHTTSYGYDDALRLTTVTYPPTGQNGSAYKKYTYQYTGGPLSDTAIYPEGTDPYRGALMSVHNAYGVSGELASKSGDTEACFLTYDALYRLASLADGGGNQGGYATNYTYAETATQTEAATSSAATYPLAGTYTAGVTQPVSTGSPDQFGVLPDPPTAAVTDAKNVQRNLILDGPTRAVVHIAYPATPQDDLWYSYDLYGRVLALTHGASDASYQDKTTYTYDDLGSVLQKVTYFNSGAISSTQTFTYYANGQRASMATSAGTFTYSYNMAGELTGLTSPKAATTTWSYLNNGHVGQQTSDGGSYLTTYTYDARGFVKQIYNSSGDINGYSLFGGISRDAAGNILGLTATIGVQTGLLPPSPNSTRSLGGAISPLLITPIPVPTSPLSGTTAYSYAHNANDSSDLLEAYGPLRREQSTRFTGGYIDTYAYDQAFNALRLRGTGSLTYDHDNRRTGSDFVYDANGNPTTYGHSGWASLQYDAADRLISYPTRNGMITAAYNGAGLRARKTVGGVDTYFVYDGLIPLLEMNAAGTVKAVNTFGATGLISRWSSSSGATYYQFDPMGNVASYNTAGGTITPTGFDAYGWQASTPPAGDPFGFQAQWGAYTESWLGFVLMGHRYYDPDTGRWLTRDPIGYAGGINLYAYCGNNPVNYADPLGFCGGGGIGSGGGDGGGNGGPGSSPFLIGGAAPTLPDGSPAPPPIPLPPTKSGNGPGQWVPADPSNEFARPNWKPNEPVYVPDGKGAQPRASWDDTDGNPGQDHWDYSPGNGPRQHFDSDGNRMTPEQAHGPSPSAMPGSGPQGAGAGGGGLMGLLEAIAGGTVDIAPLVMPRSMLGKFDGSTTDA